MKPLGARLSELWIAAIVVVLDQAAKVAIKAWLPLHETVPVIPGILDLTHVRKDRKSVV